jgi:hypothetical protein
VWTDARWYFAWLLLIGSLIGWPITTIYTDEPPFILGLSWGAIALTALDIIETVRIQRKDRDEGGGVT